MGGSESWVATSREVAEGGEDAEEMRNEGQPKVAGDDDDDENDDGGAERQERVEASGRSEERRERRGRGGRGRGGGGGRGDEAEATRERRGRWRRAQREGGVAVSRHRSWAEEGAMVRAWRLSAWALDTASSDAERQAWQV